MKDDADEDDDRFNKRRPSATGRFATLLQLKKLQAVEYESDNTLRFKNGNSLLPPTRSFTGFTQALCQEVERELVSVF